MINTELLEYAVKLAIMSPFIKKERPVSLVLLAPPEHAKSEILKKYVMIESVRVSTDFNTFHLAEFVTEYQLGKKRTIMIPDFLRVVKRKYSVQANSISALSALTEEGWVGKLPLGQVVDRPVTANVITALTESELKDKRYKWARRGFMSRFVPLSYSYDRRTKDLIREYIKNRVYQQDDPYVFETPKNNVDVVLPPDIAEEVRGITLNIALGENILGFRLQRQLQVLTMANALVSGRTVATTDDVKVIETLSKFINFDFKEI